MVKTAHVQMLGAVGVMWAGHQMIFLATSSTTRILIRNLSHRHLAAITRPRLIGDHPSGLTKEQTNRLKS